jgi:hypothetical protein
VEADSTDAAPTAVAKARQMSRAERRALVERENPTLPVSQQCRLLAVSHSSVYREAAAVSAEGAHDHCADRSAVFWLGPIMARAGCRRVMHPKSETPK